MTGAVGEVEARASPAEPRGGPQLSVPQPTRRQRDPAQKRPRKSPGWVLTPPTCECGFIWR